MKYYLIAGEASGDLHAGNLLRALLRIDPLAQVRAWGGDAVAAAGADLRRHYRDHAIMGLGQVLTKLPTILGNFRFCKQDILDFAPDALILVDYSGFNLRIARWAKSQNIRVFYYISPQVWATRARRVHAIKKYVEAMFVILPFEEAFYAKYNYKVHFVGHPLLDAIEQYHATQSPESQALFWENSQLQPDAPILALLPGSRRQEIRAMLPAMLQAAANAQTQIPNLQIATAAAPALAADFYTPFLEKFPSVRLLHAQTYALLSHARAALVTSGTATLETALFGVPQLVCYRTSWLFYLLVRWLIRVPFISLVNLLLQRAAVPEMLQNDCAAAPLTAQLLPLLDDSPQRAAQLADYAQLRQLLGNTGASQRTAQLLFDLLQKPPANS